MGQVLNDIGQFDKALEFHNKALGINKEMDDMLGIAIDYSNIGLV